MGKIMREVPASLRLHAGSQSGRIHPLYPRSQGTRRGTGVITGIAHGALFLPSRGYRLFRPSRVDSRSDDRGPWPCSPRNSASFWSRPVRATCAGALPQHRRGAGVETAPSPGNTARCTSPTTPATTRNFTSPPAISASTPSKLPSANSACWSAGISGTRKRPA